MSMTKEELERYARDNRERLKKQAVKFGDIVKVLKGHFAGKQGVVKEMVVLAPYYDDVYYSLDMDCEVPEKYRIHKGNPIQNKVVGGLLIADFEVVGHVSSPAEILQTEKELEEQQKAMLEEVNNSEKPACGANLCDLMQKADESYVEYLKTLSDINMKRLSKEMKFPISFDLGRANAGGKAVDWLSYRMELAKVVMPIVGSRNESPASIIADTKEIVDGIVEWLKEEKE